LSAVIVFVHGVPETAAIWNRVRAAIQHESVALSLPGFGCDRPDGFGATMDDYVDWLVGELDQIDGPIDLVGHDWGAGLTFRVATAHGDRLRSWAADVGNIAHPEYVWHAIAQLWQTPGDGEAFVASQREVSAEERAPGLETMGISAAQALEMAAGLDETMGGCILALYRSAVPNIHDHWGPWSPTSAPGLIVHPSDDPFSDEVKAREVADAFEARFETLDGAGHFWPYQAPDKAAAVLESFWVSLP
jgi:pimeloyl-ACP methyl ester carboxylesterase